MWRHNYFMVTLCFGFLLVSCHAQKDDLLQTLKDLSAGLNAMESHHAAAKMYQEQILKRIENLTKDIKKSDQRLEKMLKQSESKLLTKIEDVEKEMRDRGTRVENILADGQQVVEKDLKEIETQTLQMKEEIMRGFGEFGDHCGKNQSEAIAERLRQEWANFSRNPFREVPDLHRPASNELISCNINMNAQGCHRLLKEGVTKNGIYQLQMEGQNASYCAYCDMTEDGGGWTVIMRRGDYGANQTSFFRKWSQYRNGFGNLEQEFWLGNEKIHAITSSGEFQLRVILTAFDGDVLRINFDSFTVESEEMKYALFIWDANVSNERKPLQHHNGALFSTWDRDNDRGADKNCASLYQSGWWFQNCYEAIMTGVHNSENGIKWKTWKNSARLKGVEMKIRPKTM